ncbi:hypothetical protein Q4I30_004792 [Leishmania utingensis]|uniref:Uncharacterized protein n=1 Tax=Leishmania utingensis TaxID=653362 RepID=A0AAW3AB67_9TRYP
MPAAAISLFPCISSASPLPPSASSHMQKALGGLCSASPRRGSGAAAATLHRTTPAQSQRDDNNADDSGRHYDGEYDRLIFSPIHPNRAAFTAAPGSLLSHHSVHHYSESLPLSNARHSPPSQGLITASQAAAALDRLPELPTSQRRQAASSAVTALIAGRAAAASTLSSTSCRPCSKTPPAVSTDALPLQPEAWWSTLDGTLSATNTLLGDESQQLYHIAETPSPAPSHPFLTPSLNSTLGRADRAAIVLSTHLSRHTNLAPGGSVATEVLRAKDGDADASVSSADRTIKDDEATAAAVAAVAMRLSCATAGGSLSGGLSGAANTMLSNASRGSGGQNTLQGLRETLRRTQSSPVVLEIPAPHIAPHCLDMSEEGYGSLSSFNKQSKPAPSRTTGTSRTHRWISEGVAPPHGSQDGGTGIIKRGGGTQRIRDPAVHLYAQNAPRAPAPVMPLLPASRAFLPSELLPGGTAGDRAGKVMRGLHQAPSAIGSRMHNTETSFVGSTADPNAATREGAGTHTDDKDGRMNAASHALPPPLHRHRVAVAVTAAKPALTLPWERDRLTLEAMERRYGAQSAVHTLRRRRRYHGYRRSEVPPAADRRPRGSHAETLALLTSPVASSVPTSDFSAASLTSSIFIRELGEVEAARQMLEKHRWRLATPREAVSSASDDVAQRSRSPSRHGTSGTQAHLPHGMTGREATAKAYRQEQLRLYVSHLTTPSTLPTDGSVAVEQGQLDAGRPPRGTEHHTAGASANDALLACAPGGDAASSTRRSRAGAATFGASNTAATVAKATASKLTAVATSGRNALDRALQARAALLRRHAQDQSTWKRQLHQVRQWCDRTHVMVRFDNGVCAEQMAAAPLHRTVARQHQRQDRQGATEVSHRPSSGDAHVGAGIFVAKMSDDAAGQHFVYVDDPIRAHDAVMQQLAEEDNEVQRQNELQRCRERRHAPSLEWCIGDSHTSPSAPPMQSVGSGRAAAQAISSSSLSHRSENHDATRTQFSSAVDAGWDLLKSMPLLIGLDTNPAPLQVGQRSVQFVISATDELAAKGTSSMLLTQASPLSIRPPQMSMHTALCARLQTWGTDVADEEEALSRGGSTPIDTAALPPADAASAGLNACTAPPTWQGARKGSVPCSRRATLPADLSENSPGRSANESKGEPGDSAQKRTTQHGATPSLIHLQRASLSQSVQAILTRVERDLLIFVLTCASGDGGVERLAALFSLCSGRRIDNSAVECPSDSAAGEGRSLATPLPPALVALLTMLDQSPQTPICDGTAVEAAAAQETSSSGATEAKEQHGVGRESPLSSPRDLEVKITQETTDVRGDAYAVAGFPSIDHESGNGKGSATTTLPTDRASAAAPTPEKTVPPWSALVTSLLSGYNILDLSFLRQLHLLLWHYETQEYKRACITVAETSNEVVAQSVLPPPPSTTMPYRSQRAPPAVLPLSLQLSTSQETRMAFRTSFRLSDSGRSTLSTVLVDAADLLNAITATTLFRWLCDACRQSPTSSWAELVERVPATCAQDWQNALMRCIEAASSEVHPPQCASSKASLWSDELRRLSTPFPTGPAATTAPPPSPRQLECFAFDTASALESVKWRLRRIHDVLHRASLRAEQERITANTAAATDATVGALFTAGSISNAVPAAFPCVGDTPYLPGVEVRARYPLDMRNLYLLSALAAEDIDARVVPQLREARVQYADALQAATAPGTLASVSGSSSVSKISPLAFSRSAASLPLALQQRVPLDRLFQIEQRFARLLSALWNAEQSIFAFNRHVAPFNAFTAAEQRCWGSLYRSSLKVAYFVCEELTEKGMESVSTELLPFVSIVASFTGCCGGHRELLSKLNAIMLDLAERAKKVQVPLESLSWQKKRPQVLAEAIAASKIACRRAAAVVSCLTTEADVVGLPLTELAMPALRLIHVLPLSQLPDNA